MLAGANIFTVSSSWPLSRIAHWRSLLVARAVENQAFVVATNRVGCDGTTRWGGTSIIVSPLGEVLAEGSQTATQTISADVDPQVALSLRETFPVLQDVRPDLIGKIKVQRVTA